MDGVDGFVITWIPLSIVTKSTPEAIQILGHFEGTDVELSHVLASVWAV